MLLMSEALKDKIDANSIFEEKSENIVYPDVKQETRLLCSIHMSSGESISGSVRSFEKNESSLNHFTKVKMSFLSNRFEIASFMSEDKIERVSVGYQDVDIFECDLIALLPNIIKKIEVLEDNSILCKLTITQVDK
jgi:hypothetical protein